VENIHENIGTQRFVPIFSWISLSKKLVSSRLDHCNLLLKGITRLNIQDLLEKLETLTLSHSWCGRTRL